MSYQLKHVWTYAVGFSETDSAALTQNCPCVAIPGGSPPSFIGNNYYCELGFADPASTRPVFNTNDPLWDGSGCNTNYCADVTL